MISIILPTYNECENIEILIPMICETFRGREYEIIVVDDSSPDGTGKAVLKMAKKNKHLRLITRKYRTGIGGAISEGYNYASGDIIISSDADLSLNPVDMLELLKRIDDGFDMVIGSKYSSGAEYKKNSIRKVLQAVVSRFGNVYIRVMLGIPLTDFTLNFRAFKKSILKDISTKEQNNVMLLEMIYRAHIKGLNITSIPIRFHDRKHGMTKFRFFRNSLPFLTKTTIIGFKRVLNINKEW